MAAGVKIETAGEKLTLGCGLEILTEWLRSLPASDINARGVVLANDRLKIAIMHDDKPVTYTLSLYAQRDPLSEGEADKITATAAERERVKTTKANDEQSKRERETKRAFDLGQESTLSALKNIGTLVQSAQVLNKLSS